MPLPGAELVALDYSDAKKKRQKILENLSGVAMAGDYMWTAADEGRTLECLARDGDGYRTIDQVSIDDLIADVPGADDKTELDLESLDVADNHLWVCGSHCRTRDKSDAGRLSPVIRPEASGQFLARFELKDGGRRLAKGLAVPFKGKDSLRAVLKDANYVGPHLALPTKENGFDIEGVAGFDDEILLGLRGPVVAGIAIVVHLRLDERFTVQSCATSLLDLGGLGIRELTRHGEEVLVLAGPMAEASGPFRLYAWKPMATPDQGIQRPVERFSWPQAAKKPEGLCLLDRGGKRGMLVLYDKPESSTRISGYTYRGDWVPL